MHTLRIFGRNLLLGSIITLQTLFFPLAGYANTDADSTQTVSDPGVSPTQSETSESGTVQPPADNTSPPPDGTAQPATIQQQSVAPPPASTTTSTPQAATASSTPPRVAYGPNRPGGADANTFKYNPASGYWENDYYAWSPITQLRMPKQPQYRYNAAAGSWEMTDWRYNPALGRYVPFPLLISQPPRSALIANTGPNSTNTITSNSALAGSITGTGPNSSNSILIDSDGDGDIDFELNASITNNLNATATSGNAGILQNTTGGNATTGDAASIANILNILQSSWGLSAAELATFSADIYGNVVGDLLLDPSKLPSQLNVSGQDPLLDNLTINGAVNGQINNNIVLNATSGDARVSGNTTGGNATTGDATAMANVINMINSAIAANQSFIGNINIYGNLEGDILLPDWLKTSLLAASNFQNPTTAIVDGTGPGSTNDINHTNQGSLDLDLDTNHLINSNVTVTATSGNALVNNNTIAGNATTGDASTNITLLNLTGRQIVGSNSLLVFVNVLGKWVGLIVDAPASATSAALGSGITQNSSALPNNLDADITTNSEINNNINVSANSGDAIVSNNTRAGDATTGDATAGVNLLNIVNSSFALSDWFGVLFINVFGSWHGSFGVDTAYGNPVTPGGAGQTNGGGGQNTTGNTAGAFGFRPGPADGNGGSTRRRILATSFGNFARAFSTEAEEAGMLASTDENKPQTSSTSTDEPSNMTSAVNEVANSKGLWQPIMIGGFLALLLLGGERLIALRRP